jgi:exopolysaccharide biosynthesis polyprenyl glycosylphosphotransferase
MADRVTADAQADLREPRIEVEGSVQPGRDAARRDEGTAYPTKLQAGTWSARVYPRAGTRPRVVNLGAWTILLMCVDGCMAAFAVFVGSAARFGGTPPQMFSGIPYLALAAALPVVWVGAMSLGRSYDRRYLAAGAEQFRRVGNSAMWVLGLIAFASFVLRADFSRGFVAITIPVATVLTLLGRWGIRSLLRRRFRQGAAIHRVVAVGGFVESDQLGSYVARNPHTGFALVGTFATDPADLPLDIDQLVADVRRMEADTIAFVGTGRFRARELRQISWALHGSGIVLLVVPDLADIAGPRIGVSPVEGLPLLEICEPELSGVGKLTKSMVDRLGSLVFTAALSPILLAIAACIKLNDGGPIFYRQSRIGKDGRAFRIWKFRTMRVDAAPRFRTVESGSGSVRILEKQGGGDDRITSVGRFLRKYSLDELPQLFNVLSGTMSLVGPRPLVPDEVASFGHGAQLRLLVAPGMTGLWQVSGRSELPWEERIHLDLYYIENWSMWLDFSLLWRTLRVIIRSNGAY